jgi:drug/metabolite transporter (DMT)-like permease
LRHLNAHPETFRRTLPYLEPLVAVVVAFILLDEVVTVVSLLEGSLILLGVYQVNRTPRTR